MVDQYDSPPSVNSLSPTEQFLRLLLPNQKRIYAYILTLVPHWSDADDIMQETTTAMWRKFDEFERGTDFVAWGVSIARYEVLRFRRKQGANRLQFSDDLLNMIAQQVEAAANQADERLDALNECLEKLPERDRKLIRLRYESDVTIRTVAERVGRPVQGMYKAMARIHDALLQCIRRSLAAEETR